jgi:DNA-directed RNA polymerase specialized sigma24 family protein
MSDESQDQRLCSITTLWSVVLQAHQRSGDAAREAQHRLLGRYGGAIRRYLTASLRDPAAAEDLYHEFTLRFLRGDFRRADPGKGRFRDYIKTILYHMLTGHHRRRRRQPRPLEHDPAGPAVEAPPGSEADIAFLARWRDELLARSWDALAREEAEGGPPAHTVLRFRADHPGLDSKKLAEGLGTLLGKPLGPAAARQALHRARERFAALLIDHVANTLRARERFAALLIDHVANTLGASDVERVERELIDLGLIGYCRPALGRRVRAG